MACHHDIRNALIGYRLERRRIMRLLMAQVECISQVDKHIIRMEEALHGCARAVGRKPETFGMSWWKKILYYLKRRLLWKEKDVK
jgi:hypothetical protein